MVSVIVVVTRASLSGAWLIIYIVGRGKKEGKRETRSLLIHSLFFFRCITIHRGVGGENKTKQNKTELVDNAHYNGIIPVSSPCLSFIFF